MHILACLCARKDLGSSFYNCASPVKLVQACLSAGNVSQIRFNRRECTVKLVQAYISVRKDLESSYHHSGSLVRLVQACL